MNSLQQINQQINRLETAPRSQLNIFEIFEIWDDFRPIKKKKI